MQSMLRRFSEYQVNIKPIRTNRDYRQALSEIETLMSARANTPEGDRLDVLATLVEAYERAHFPMDLPDAVDAIKFRMDQAGLTVEDLEPVIGRRNRVYEVLSRRRPLTLRMIEGLHTKFGIPAESLIKQRAANAVRTERRTRQR
jgi:HTH-type transcriptional regulator/antitoxin HigA